MSVNIVSIFLGYIRARVDCVLNEPIVVYWRFETHEVFFVVLLGRILTSLWLGTNVLNMALFDVVLKHIINLVIKLTFRLLIDVRVDM